MAQSRLKEGRHLPPPFGVSTEGKAEQKNKKVVDCVVCVTFRKI